MAESLDLHRKFIIGLFLLLYLIVLLRNAWVCDDAYISFRVVDNFVNGYGLRWNIAERVQAFTHPLWVFVLIPLYAITGEIYFTVLTLSALLCLAALGLFAFGIARSWLIACLGILALTLSDAFIDYSTSGLENPLSFFLMALFLYLFLRKEASTHRLLLLSVIAALAAVNRLDTILLYLPPLVYAFWQVKSRRAIKNVILGFTPLIAWELFSLMYYGFPFPNTAYAKLNTGISSGVLMKQGVCYVINSLSIDPITILMLISAILLPVIFRDRKYLILSLGLLCGVAYIIKIGGCFMSGRYFALLLVVAVSILAHYLRDAERLHIGLVAGICLFVGLTSDFSPVWTRYDQGQNHEPVHFKNTITDERKFYFLTSGLINFDRNALYWPNDGWVYQGQELKAAGTKVFVTGYIGAVGFNAGPGTHIIDFNALADPLLARLPVLNKYKPAIGHFERVLPQGYEESITTGRNKIYDKSLAAYYSYLRTITRNDIFSWARFKDLFLMNVGAYDYLIREYLESDFLRIDYSAVSSPKDKGTAWNAVGNIVIKNAAVDIVLPGVRYARTLDISRDNNDGYTFEFRRGEELIGACSVPPELSPMEGLAPTRVTVPEAAAANGFDRIRVYPDQGDGMFSIGHVILLDEE